MVEIVVEAVKKMGKSKGRSRPIPDASVKKVAQRLEAAFIHEATVTKKYNERNSWEVTMQARDGAVHVMRFLKVWFDLPQNVFFAAVSYLDEFLDLMKVLTLSFFATLDFLFVKSLFISTFSSNMIRGGVGKLYGVNLTDD